MGGVCRSQFQLRHHLDDRGGIFVGVCQFADNLPIFEKDDSIRIRGGAGVVRDHDDRGVEGFAGIAQEFEDFCAGFGVEVARRFVGEDDFRFVDEGAGDGDPLLLATGELIGFVVAAVGEADEGEQIINQGGVFLDIFAIQQKGQGDIFCRAEGGEQVEELENKTHLPSSHEGDLVVGQVGHALAAQDDFAVRGTVQPTEQMEQGGFAGAGRPHDGDKFALSDFKVDVAKGVHGDFAHGVGFGEGGGLEDRHREISDKIFLAFWERY